MKKPHSQLTAAALACAVMYWVLDLSASGRSGIDYAVIGLVAAAILWHLVQLGRRLHRTEGRGAVWHLQRTVLLWIIGLFNTALVKTEHVGTWRHWLGWALVGLAVVDTIALFRIERRSIRGDQVDA